MAGAPADADLAKLFDRFRKLGKLKQFDGAKGQAMMSTTVQQGSRITANYVGSAEFETGPAQIYLGLVKHGQDWQILHFRVESKAFLDMP